MITIGVDAHKRVHAAVALDETGREVAQWRGSATACGWDELRCWAATLGAPRQWGIEGAWNYGRGLAQHLVGAGEAVYEVNPRWTAAGRRGARRRGKSDALDAQAVAGLVLREAATLPQVAPDDEAALLDLLVTEREAAIASSPRRPACATSSTSCSCSSTPSTRCTCPGSAPQRDSRHWRTTPPPPLPRLRRSARPRCGAS